jgi:hypothetical protein
MDLRNNLQGEEEDRTFRRIKGGIGLLLVAMGVAGVLWIFERIIALGDGPQNTPLIAKFLSFDAVARTLVTPSGNYELPEGLYFAAGLFLYIVVLGVVAGLAKALITAGGNLLEQAGVSVANRLGEEFGRLREYLESSIKSHTPGS